MSSASTVYAITTRPIDGSNNKRSNVTWGQANTEEVRLTSVDYLDDISIIRTDMDGRPNAREVSTAIFSQLPNEQFLDENNLNEMTWSWGQFIDHDIDFTGGGEESHDITIPTTDPAYGLDSDGLINAGRKAFVPGRGTSTANPRQLNNIITTWLEGSVVYGSDEIRANALRTNGGIGAKLRTHEFGDPSTDNDNLLPTAQDLIDAGVTVPDMAMAGMPRMGDNVRFIMGDVRGNENTAIIALHTLMVREHNRIVDLLTIAAPGLSDEDKYQLSKKVVGAEMQAVTYNEYLPAIGVTVDTSGGYDTAIDPIISVEFSSAIYRMAHTFIHQNALPLKQD